MGVKSVESISRMTGIHEVALGFLLLSVSTSLPELAVSISATAAGHASTSIGNVFSSNIADICLVVGVAALMKPIILRHELEEIHRILFLTSIIPIILLQLGEASQLIGLLLLGLFLFFCYYTLKKRVVVREAPLPLRFKAS